MEQDASVKAVGRDAVERVYRTEGPKIWRALVAYSGDVDIAHDACAQRKNLVVCKMLVTDAQSENRNSDEVQQDGRNVHHVIRQVAPA